MNHRREIVITGQGVVCPIGVGTAAFWQSVCQQRSGVGPLSMPGAGAMIVPFGAEIKGFDGKQFVKPRKSLKVMCPEIQWAYSSTMMAMDQAGLTPDDYEADRCGVVFGAEMYYCPIDDVEAAYRGCKVNGSFDYELWTKQGIGNLYPLWMLKYLPNMPACHIAIGLTAHGLNNTIATGESSSLLALIEACNVIERGIADIMITGGSGNRLSLTPTVNRGAIGLSRRKDAPQAACRPFDADRDGMVNGEGAAAFVLESWEHAQSRGATVLARILGYGRAFDPQPYSSADAQCEFSTSSEGMERAIQAALKDANLRPDDLGHVNAHGVSTVEGDVLEARAIESTVGDVPVTALKSYFGNLGGGAGAVEMVGTLLAFEHGEIPVTLNYESPDPQCPVNVVHTQPRATDRPTALLLSRSGTGQSVAVVLGKNEDPKG